MADDEMALQMAEGEMDVELPAIGKFHTKGFRLYSLILLALIGFLVAVFVGSKDIALISNVLTFLIGVFTGKKA
ncbi:hypothetical protein M0R72_11055 [Candidatus Pacearchaeota archaeon]|jgi:hypothetical protein|nr:hypothetical protein [Candidatus Pacearchaeota archaeon]